MNQQARESKSVNNSNNSFQSAPPPQPPTQSTTHFNKRRKSTKSLANLKTITRVEFVFGSTENKLTEIGSWRSRRVRCDSEVELGIKGLDRENVRCVVWQAIQKARRCTSLHFYIFLPHRQTRTNTRTCYLLHSLF